MGGVATTTGGRPMTDDGDGRPPGGTDAANRGLWFGEYLVVPMSDDRSMLLCAGNPCWSGPTDPMTDPRGGGLTGARPLGGGGVLLLWWWCRSGGLPGGPAWWRWWARLPSTLDGMGGLSGRLDGPPPPAVPGLPEYNGALRFSEEPPAPSLALSDAFKGSGATVKGNIDEASPAIFKKIQKSMTQ